MADTHVITGANRGLGLELARQLAARGESVIATSRRPRDGSPLDELDLRVEQLDQSDPESIASFARHVGDEPVDVLINNAGMGVGGARFEDEDWDAVGGFFQVNSLGPMRVTRALLGNLRAGRRKLVVNMTSKMGSIADNTSGGAHGYRASKAALNMLTRSMAIDLADEGFTCVVLHPGWVATRMGGAAAPLSVEESVRGLLRVIDALGPDDTGSFLTHAGETVPW